MPSIPEIQELKNEIEIRLGRIPSHLILSDFVNSFFFFLILKCIPLRMKNIILN